MGATVVEKVKFGVIISEFFLKFKDAIASRFAEDPELTIKPYFFPNKDETFFSKILTFLPSTRDKLSFLRTFKTLNPIYKAIEQTREKLDKEKSLISFVGAPWTLLIYMMGLKENKNIINVLKIQDKRSEINIILDNLLREA